MTDKSRWHLDLVATIAILFTCSAILWSLASRNPSSRGREIPVPKEAVSLTDLPRQGDAAASAVMIEFGDFQCSACARFANQTLPRIIENYVRSGKLQISYWHLPLSTIHPFAVRAALAADCAERQNRFWSMHDLLFAHIGELNDATLARSAERLQLDSKSFATCLSATPERVVMERAAEANRLGITSTPSFLIGTRTSDGRLKVTKTIQGNRPYHEFAGTIDLVVQTARRH